MLIIARKDHS